MRKIVVKIGSSIIAPQGKLNSALIGRIVQDILETEKKGVKVVLVSSGAIACGLNALGYKNKPSNIHSLMAFSSLGQIRLMNIYADKFKKHKKHCAQILLTWDNFDDRRKFLNARYTINKLLDMGVTPIINENDAVSFEEIRFGDNDRLSALLADLIGAESLIILSDVEGLLDNGKLVKAVYNIDSNIRRLVKQEKSKLTAGGMAAKIEAANVAVSSGIKAIIAAGRVRAVISRAVKGEQVGTIFFPLEKIAKAKKRWIAFSKKIKGKIYIDDGAREALINRDKSLLVVGLVKFEGEFKKKDAVEVCDARGNILGSGLINYSCEELKEHKTKKFEKEIIHRNDFVENADGRGF
ncbi:MAG: glutamate 5-kinase [Candidatus Omnitrophota bacterium]